MATYYMDFAGGNDANAGTSFATRWKTLTSGATAARIAAGDTIRIMATPDETLVGNATWTNLSKTVTLATAVTANITDCETAWTASANVTATADAAIYKEGTKSAKLVIATPFTTGLVAYFPTGTLDLSAYQQVSFWVLNSNLAVAASSLSIRLCSDAAGVTTVHTVALPAIPAGGTQHWVPITVDLAGALSSSIQSVALYADIDPGAVTIWLDNIIACKASSAADSLTLTSLIGKVHNRSWVASTSYATDSIRRPTQPNRNGFAYKVTAGGGGNSGSTEPTWPLEYGLTVTDGALTWTCTSLEDTYYALQSINGTTVKIDNVSVTNGNAGKGYAGTTETVATYKRETVSGAMETNFSSTTAANYTQKAGTVAGLITFSGGWNRTDMSTQTGETWRDGQNGWGSGLICQFDYTAFENINAVRFYVGIVLNKGTTVWRWELKNCHLVSNSGVGFQMLSCLNSLIRNVTVNNGSESAFFSQSSQGTTSCITVNNNLTTGTGFNLTSPHPTEYNFATAKNNDHNGGVIGLSGSPIGVSTFRNLTTSNNLTVVGATLNAVALVNCLFGEASPITAPAYGFYVRSQKHNQTADNHLITAYGATIISATDQRHTASGISWKYRITDVLVNAYLPVVMPIARIAVSASALVTLSIWARRDNTNIQGQMRLRGGQLLGVSSTLTVACAPTINTWTQYSLTFTPTEAGVVEVDFLTWDGVGTTNNFWIDDFAASQA